MLNRIPYFVTFAFACLASPLMGADKPNILFIMVDDLGKEWLSCYGSEDIQTPNIDKLAAGGMKFNNAYSMPKCTPSRLTLLTGQYPWRNGWANHWDVPRWGVGYFDWKQPENMTFARLMQEQGYVTCAAGKWQINDFRLEPEAMKKHGFDDWCMWTGFEGNNEVSESRYYDPYINTPRGSETYVGEFGPDVFTDRLIAFMWQNKSKPMCLYYPMTLGHSPKVATPDEPELADGKGSAKFKSMVRYTDKLVGRLVQGLEDMGIRENTIVIFTADNGTSGGKAVRNGILVRGGKGMKTEAGVCEPFIVNCPGKVPAGVETDALTDFSDMLPTFVDLGGGRVSRNFKIDGHSIAPLILGRARDSKRDWIMAMGQGSGVIDAQGLRGAKDFASRVIRDKRYKVWVSDEKKIERLHDLQVDPFEETNLIDSDRREHTKALRKFQAVVDSMPDVDARPLYEPRAANPWDKKFKVKKDRKEKKQRKNKKDKKA